MTEQEERAYAQGCKAAWRQLLAQALRELHDDPQAVALRWAAERAEAVAALRRLCARCGDNDWPDDLPLGEVIDRHLENRGLLN